MKKLNSTIVKAIGFAAAILGFAASAVSDWVTERKIEEMVDEKVQAALSAEETEENED